MKKITLLVSVLILTLCFSVVYPCVASAAEEQMDWSGWSINYSPNISTQEAKSISQNYPNLINEVKVDNTTNTLRLDFPNKVQGYYEASKGITVTDNIDFNFKLRVTGHYTHSGIEFYSGAHRAVFLFRSPSRFQYQELTEDNVIRYNSVDADIGTDWHVWRGEKRGDEMTVFMDGVELITYKLPEVGYNQNKIVLMGVNNGVVFPGMEYEYAYVTNHNWDMSLVTPAHRAVFEEGEDIVIKVNPAGNPSHVNFYINHVWSSRKTAADNYTYTFNNARPGKYIIQALSSDSKFSNQIYVFVKKNREVTISCPETAEYGTEVPLSVNITGESDISKVDYYAGSKLVASSSVSPYSASIGGLKLGSTTISAKAYDGEGAVIDASPVELQILSDGTDMPEIGQEYDLSYEYTSGDGSMVLDDGYFTLSMKHTAANITYDTAEGEKTIARGAADYRVIVTAGIAEVYRNGQLAFNFRMPRSDDGIADFTYTNGSFTNVALESSGVKAEAFRYEITNETEVNAEDLVFDAYYSLEFDKTDASNETVRLMDGSYEISLKFDSNGILAKAQPDLGGKINDQLLSDTVEPGYYRVTVYEGMAQLFKDNVFVGSFRAPQAYGKKSVRRVMSNSGSGTLVVIKNTNDVYYFSDDFSGNGESDSDDYWAAAPFSGIEASWKASDKKLTLSNTTDDNGLFVNGTYLLDATTDDFEFKTTIGVLKEAGASAFSDKKTGEVYLTLKYRNESQNIRLVYNFETKKWSLIKRSGVSNNEFVETQLASSTSGQLSPDTKYNISIIVKNDNLTLKVGNTTVFDSVALNYPGHGKIGIGLTDRKTAYIYKVDYKGAGKVNVGATHTKFLSRDPETKVDAINTVEFYQQTDGSVRATSSAIRGTETGTYASFISDDNGKTWSALIDGVMWNNAIVLRSGKFLGVAGTNTVTAYLYDAPGGNRIGQGSFTVPSEYPSSPLNGRIEQGTKVYPGATEPRVFYITHGGREEQGWTFLYFSDDEGLTWTSMSTMMTHQTLGGHNINETDVVELPDGTVRIYFRNDRGFIYYSDSHDGGRNFEIPLTSTQFLTPLTAIAVCRDMDNPNTYYMQWEYEVSNLTKDVIQTPRNRQAIAVSYDGCKTWEYVLDMDDLGPNPELGHAQANIRVIDGTLYVSFAHLYERTYAPDTKVYTTIVAIDTEKIKNKTLLRFTEPHKTVSSNVTLYDVLDEQCVLPKETGTALLFGEKVPARANNGYVEADIVARAFGAYATVSDNKVIFTIGAAGKLEFTNGQTGYDEAGVHVQSDLIACIDGYVNVKLCSQIFGRVCTETETSYIITKYPQTEVYLAGLENIASGVYAEETACIADFKNISSVSELKAFFNEYALFLNISTEFEEQSFENMYNSYLLIDMSTITDYASICLVVNGLINAEKESVDAFVAAMNAAEDASAIEELMTVTYAGLLNFVIDTSEVEDSLAVYKRMLGITYYKVADIEQMFKAALAAQKTLELGHDNAVILSSVSAGFDSWGIVSTDNIGGVSIKTGEENIASLSAYDGLLSVPKAEIQPAITGGLVYSQQGNVAGTTTGAVSIDGNTIKIGGEGAFTLQGTGTARSNTMIAVFDIKRPTDEIKVTIKTGHRVSEVVIDAEGTDIGKLPKELLNKDGITYRIEASQNTVTVLAKASDENDKYYRVLGEKSNTSLSSLKWSIKIESFGGQTDVSNLGVYSALSSVKYSTAGYTLADNFTYAADGASGFTMADFLAKVSKSSSVSVNSSTGYLELNRISAVPYVELSNGRGFSTKTFDRCELEITLPKSSVSGLGLEFHDGSDWRYMESNSERFQPGSFNNISTNYTYPDNAFSSDLVTMRLVTQMVDFHQDGGYNKQTVASLYVKGKDNDSWVCLAQDKLLTNGVYLSSDSGVKVAILGLSGTTSIKSISIKTYVREKGTYNIINTTKLPETDYYFTFDYNTLAKNEATSIKIGGGDYGLNLTIKDGKISSLDTIPVYSDVALKENKWYTFIGKVTMTADGSLAQFPNLVTKNTLTLYCVDDEGNKVNVFSDLPMLKTTFSDGLQFALLDTSRAAVYLKNIRVYCGKAADVIMAQAADGTATATVDFLNDDVAIPNLMVSAGVYAGDKMTALSASETVGAVKANEAKRYTIDGFNYNEIDNQAPNMKLFFWENMTNMKPVISPIRVD